MSLHSISPAPHNYHHHFHHHIEKPQANQPMHQQQEKQQQQQLHRIDTFNGLEKEKEKDEVNMMSHMQLSVLGFEERKSSFLNWKSQSIEMNLPAGSANAIDNSQQGTASLAEKKRISDAIKKRLASENQHLLDIFASTYIYHYVSSPGRGQQGLPLHPPPFNIKNPSTDNLADKIIYTLDNSNTRYLGESQLNSDIKSGKGVLISIDGHSYYFGDFANNLKEGHGIEVFRNQERYEGSYISGERSGSSCTYYFANGDIYTGEFAHNKRNGQGKLVSYNQCTTFVGTFVNDKREGKGLLLNMNGQIISEGIFKDDVPISMLMKITSKSSTQDAMDVITVGSKHTHTKSNNELVHQSSITISHNNNNPLVQLPPANNNADTQSQRIYEKQSSSLNQADIDNCNCSYSLTSFFKRIFK